MTSMGPLNIDPAASLENQNVKLVHFVPWLTAFHDDCQQRLEPQQAIVNCQTIVYEGLRNCLVVLLAQPDRAFEVEVLQEIIGDSLRSWWVATADQSVHPILVKDYLHRPLGWLACDDLCLDLHVQPALDGRKELTCFL